MYIYLILALVQLLFALNFLATKVLMNHLATFDWALVRFFGASIGMVLIAFIFHRTNWPKISFKYLWQVALLGLVGIVFTQVAFIKGISLTTATNASILATMIPMFTLLIVVLRGEEKLTLKKSLGFFLAFIGVLIIQKIEQFSFADKTVVGNSFILLSTFCVGLVLSYSKSFFKKHDHVWSTVLMFFFATLFMVPFSYFDGTNSTMELVDKNLWAYALYSIIGGTVLTYFLGNWALTKIEAAKVSLFVYLQPLFSAALAFAFLGEQFSWRVLFSLGFIFSGFLLALEKRDQREDN